MTENLLLKWGTVKGWDGLADRSIEILKRFFAHGVPMSAMAGHPDGGRKDILCQLIDQLDGEIMNDWSGEKMSKDEAKKYVRDYRT